MAVVACLAFLCLGVADVAGQTGPVGGVVVDELGRPVISVEVTLVETGAALSTDGAGRFLFPVFPVAEGTLRFERLGYRTSTQAVQAGTTSLRITVEAVAFTLDELVVTGTVGAQARRELGNSVTAIQAADVAELSRIPDAAAFLTGRSPGVEVRATSSQVGAGPQIRIRGVSSFSLNTQPLIYVDGVRVDNTINSGIAVQGFGGAIFSRINDIKPEEIESIEIIKGPAAATLYGTEASNGVIQIITKRGRAGSPRLSATARLGQWAFRNPEGRIIKNWGRPLSNRGAIRSDINAPYPAGDEPFEFDIFANERSLGNKILDTGWGQGYDVNLSGGTAATRYFVAVGLDDDQGIEPMNHARRFTGRANVTISPSEKFDITVNTGYINSDTEIAVENGGLWFSLIFNNPSANSPGPEAPLGVTGRRRGFWSAPPEIHYINREVSQLLKKTTVGVTLNHRPNSVLSWRVTAGQDQSSTDDLSFRGNTPELIPFYGETSALGSRFVARNNVQTTTFDAGASARIPINESLTSITTVGAQYFSKLATFQSATGNRFPAPDLEVVNAAEERLGTEDFVENNTLGVFAQQQINVNDRLFLVGAVRVDDNSAFGSEFSFTTYPKVSASWVVDEEPFFNVGFVDQLKVRAAFGAAGQQPDAFAALRTLAAVVGGVGGALIPQFVGNPELKPERGTEFETGIEAGLFNSRLGIDFSYYLARTKDAILSRQVAPSVGFPGAQFVNAGEIRNQGFELQLRALTIQRENLAVDLNLNLSTNANEVVNLGGIDQGQGFIAAGSQRQVPGFSTGAWFREVAVSAEIGQNGGATNVMCDGGDPNGRKLPDGTPLEMGGPAVPCSQAPRLYLGNSVPTFEGSFGPTVTLFGNLRLSALADWRTGFYKWDNNLRARCQVLKVCEETYFPERFTEAPSHFRNSSGAAYIAEIQSSGRLVSHVINDAKFFRLREVSAAYEIPRTWAERMGAENASLVVAARNLSHWSPYTGLDPENQFTARVGTGALEQNQPPPLFSYMITFRMTF
ncbi:MAG: SusC/RagA family TonB-linked outer membrane protein [Chloroflexi bacterium]|nr:SusC/RagA family TonB-linked outer membrane protein [Chloroflexota bacterium]